MRKGRDNVVIVTVLVLAAMKWERRRTVKIGAADGSGETNGVIVIRV
jgi:hypothetical protein